MAAKQHSHFLRAVALLALEDLRNSVLPVGVWRFEPLVDKTAVHRDEEPLRSAAEKAEQARTKLRLPSLDKLSKGRPFLGARVTDLTQQVDRQHLEMEANLARP